MTMQDRASTTPKPGVITTVTAAGRRSRPDRRRWPLAALVLVVVLVGGFFAVKALYPASIDDGFIAFQPSLSQFPAAPVADAQTLHGAGRPIGWPDYRRGCPYGEQLDSAFGTGWHTVRHDWTQGGSPKSWIISERTVGAADLKEYDQYEQSFRSGIRYCGWIYEEYPGGFNSISTEMDGLPDDTVAFTVDVTADVRGRGDFEQSDDRAYTALGAFVPGPTRGQVMHVLWIGWATDVPPDEFVAAVNTLYDAARAAPKKDYTVDGDPTIDVTFTKFDPIRAGVAPIVGDEATEDRGSSLALPTCNREYPDFRIFASSMLGEGVTDHGVKTDTSKVSFAAARWTQRSKYLEAKDYSVDQAAPLCIGSFQTRTILIEPVTVPGLPPGAIVGRWADDGGAYAALVTDDDKQMLMTVTWIEKSDAVPTDKFVAAVNRAWDQLQADNP